MKDNELFQLGVPRGAALEAARRCIQAASHAGLNKAEIRKAVRQVARNAAAHLADTLFGELAAIMSVMDESELPLSFTEKTKAPWKQWGENLDPKSIDQMYRACSLPVSVRGALMPDAHVGYGLPIGGVLATRAAVIPYAVGVDIACRMKLTVLDMPVSSLEERVDALRRAIEEETVFGVGGKFKCPRRQHSVMDRDWNVTKITKDCKDLAWSQLGTSGSGNHFVEFGTLEILEDGLGLEKGIYLALLSHSGSRGTGAKVCECYSKVARQQNLRLPDGAGHLAWLDIRETAGREYWAAMELMGEYAAANHALIHRHIAANLGARVLLDLENHHNFAWKERHDGEDVIVHRKGATPAGKGMLGIIPGSMGTPGFVVRGLGNPESLESASHGAGRTMSRTQAMKTYRWADARRLLEKQKITVMSAGLDEVPMVYKDIHAVMAAQRDLVEPLAKFLPRLVKMAPAGERPED